MESSEEAGQEAVPEWRKQGSGTSPSQTNFFWNSNFNRKSGPGRGYERRDRTPTTQIQQVKQIDWTKVKPERAGFIIYQKKESGIEFCLGVDFEHGEITDFAGGVSYRSDGNALMAALRELEEESLGIFGSVRPKDVDECWALYSEKMMIIFLERPFTEDTRTKFRSIVKADDEVCDLVLISQDEFKTLLRGEKLKFDQGCRERALYRRVRDLLNHSLQIFSHL